MEQIEKLVKHQERNLLVSQIGETYVKYHNLRKQIDGLKYNRNIDFKECKNENHAGYEFWEQTSCYYVLKQGNNPVDICDGCKKSWDKHLAIVKLGHQAGGLKYSLNKMIEKL